MSHHWNSAFATSGAGTELCYAIKWVGHPVKDGDQLFDHAAVLRLHPSYRAAYARWGDGDTTFAKTFTKDSQSARLRRYNFFFAKAHKEHVWAYANHDIPRPRGQELKPEGQILPAGPPPTAAE
jgi:hypothetical protein